MIWHYKTGHCYFQTSCCFYDALGVSVDDRVILFQHRATIQSLLNVQHHTGQGELSKSPLSYIELTVCGPSVGNRSNLIFNIYFIFLLGSLSQLVAWHSSFQAICQSLCWVSPQPWALVNHLKAVLGTSLLFWFSSWRIVAIMDECGWTRQISEMMDSLVNGTGSHC